MNAAETGTVEQPCEPAIRPRRSLPRFGLRALFVFSILFCLLFAWIGRNLYEFRQDEAAIEAIRGAGYDSSLSTTIRWEGRAPGVDADGELASWNRVLVALGVAERPKIRGVELSVDRPGDPASTTALRAMLRFPEIRDVSLDGAGFDDDAIGTLRELPNLESLNLLHTAATGEALASLAGNTKLTWLNITSDRRVADLQPGLAELRSLETVGLTGMECDRAGATALASLPRMRSLHLSQVSLSDEPDLLLPLENARSLQHLSLSPQTGKAGTPERLPRISRLDWLALHGVPNATLAKWPTTPTLREVHLGLPVTAEGARAFSAAHSECDVLHSGTNEIAHFRGGEIAK